MKLTLPDAPGWMDLPFWTKDFPQVQSALAVETRDILPPAHQVFAALERTYPDDVRVVILGQDPYPTPGNAHGFAFSVEPDIATPASLRNIFKEMQDDLGAAPKSPDLRFWADQGVLLLNSALTVPAGDPKGHAKLGWTALTRQIITKLAQSPRAFVLWGGPAQALAPPPGGHLMITAPHPSPLSAYRGFFGSRPFSRINAWLAARNEAPIDWTGESFSSPQ